MVLCLNFFIARKPPIKSVKTSGLLHSNCHKKLPEAKAKIIEYLATTEGPDGTTITGVK